MKLLRLNSRHLAFVNAFVRTRNACAAAQEAGYRQPQSQGPRLLRNVLVSKEIRRRDAALAKRTDLKLDDIVAELRLVAFSDIGDYLPLLTSPDPVAALATLGPARRAIRSLDVRTETIAPEGEAPTTRTRLKLQLWNKADALWRLGRHLGLRTGTLKIEMGHALPPLDGLEGLTDQQLEQLDEILQALERAQQAKAAGVTQIEGDAREVEAEPTDER